LRHGIARKTRFQHISPGTLNVALKRLPLKDVEHVTVHDMRRTARTQMAALGINRFVAERALNHKIRDVQGIYDQHDYFSERKIALAKWAALLVEVSTSAA
jgi:integrase